MKEQWTQRNASCDFVKTFETFVVKSSSTGAKLKLIKHQLKRNSYFWHSMIYKLNNLTIHERFKNLHRK
jgi:hypothetical protein